MFPFRETVCTANWKGHVPTKSSVSNVLFTLWPNTIAASIQLKADSVKLGHDTHDLRKTTLIALALGYKLTTIERDRIGSCSLRPNIQP